MSHLMTHPDTDIALMRRIAAGDARAFAAVYDRHAAAAFGLARSMLAPAAAEEVVQECFLALWRAPAYRAERGSLRTFLLTVVRNRAIDVLRADGRRAAAPAQQEETADVVSIDEAVERREDARALRTALAVLPEPQREAIALAYLGGLTQLEIATRLGVPVGTVKGRIRLGLRRLRTQLEAA
jgi:RNA polymerase sigma-70 factor (ECF subfamily)